MADWQLGAVLTPATKMVSLGHVSNMLGCINPVEEVIELAHGVGALVCLDACQSVPHMKVCVNTHSFSGCFDQF